jgi:osmotically-inducible protein OsmY
MRRILSSLFVVGLCLSMPVVWVACASTPTRESAGEYVDDSWITTKVKSELAADKMLSLHQISVETYKGVVQLSGFVNTKEQRENAGVIARKIKGVQEVKNSLIVKAS